MDFSTYQNPLIVEINNYHCGEVVDYKITEDIEKDPDTNLDVTLFTVYIKKRLDIFENRVRADYFVNQPLIIKITRGGEVLTFSSLKLKKVEEELDSDGTVFQSITATCNSYTNTLP